MSKNLENLKQAAWEFASNFPVLDRESIAEVRAQLAEALAMIDERPDDFLGVILTAGFKNVDEDGDEGVATVGAIAGTSPALYACSLMSREVSRDVGDSIESDALASKLRMMSLAEKVTQLDSAEGLRDLLSGADCDCPKCRLERGETSRTIH